jgi:hypothetical protein
LDSNGSTDVGWVKEGRAGDLRGAVEELMRLSDDRHHLGRVLPVTPTWVEHKAFNAEVRTQP